MAKRRKAQDGQSELVRRDGALALTFVNTGSRRSPQLRHYDDLVEWAEQHGALATSEAHRLMQRAAEDPLFADTGFAAAEDMHDLLTQILTARVDHQSTPTVAIDEFSKLHTRVVPRSILASVPGQYTLRWIFPADSEDLYRPLWAVAQSASSLLTSADYGKVKRCDGEGCDVLFLSKNSGLPRKWCDIEVCGAPVRARKHYRRLRREMGRAPRSRS